MVGDVCCKLGAGTGTLPGVTERDGWGLKRTFAIM